MSGIEPSRMRAGAPTAAPARMRLGSIPDIDGPLRQPVHPPALPFARLQALLDDRALPQPAQLRGEFVDILEGLVHGRETNVRDLVQGLQTLEHEVPDLDCQDLAPERVADLPLD